MDVRNLNYILEVARQQNITKAAEHLHLSQPTLSKIIKNVEEELGVTLFDRSRKQLKLTDSGLAAVRQFQIIVEAAVELRRELEELEHLESGILTIGLPPVISSVFVPRMVAGFQKQYPRIDIRMVEEGAKTIERLVQNGQLELGFVVSPVDEQAFDRLPLLERRLSLVVH
ncbi:LysR family transcriptional regulator, partial [Paenibacillus sp. 598K]|uniref:LysR family transcriptional regulator n=1 Tax=Paenibacillus sp. 598K TaxID=1117987 RepID=UPI0021AAE8BB